jgi:hypothetical protein
LNQVPGTPPTGLFGPKDRPLRELPPGAWRRTPGGVPPLEPEEEDPNYAVLRRLDPPASTLQWINSIPVGEPPDEAKPEESPGDGGPREGQARTPANIAGEAKPGSVPAPEEPGSQTPPDRPGPLGYLFRLPLGSQDAQGTEMAADPEEEEADYPPPEDEEEVEEDDTLAAGPPPGPAKGQTIPAAGEGPPNPDPPPILGDTAGPQAAAAAAAAASAEFPTGSLGWWRRADEGANFRLQLTEGWWRWGERRYVRCNDQ